MKPAEKPVYHPMRGGKEPEFRPSPRKYLKKPTPLVRLTLRPKHAR